MRPTILLLAAASCLSGAASFAALPANFVDELVTATAGPTAIDFTPDGRLLVTRQGVSRFVLADNNTVDLATETVLVDNMPSTAGNHNAGDVQFGKDGNLYITIGDGGCNYAGGGCQGTNNASRDQFTLTGKVVRITKDGGIPTGNPFQGAGTTRCNVTGGTTAGNKCQETYSWGHRNPFRLAFDPNPAGTRFFINDVGEGSWEEIDLGQSGADFGWNCREGAHTNGSFASRVPTAPARSPPPPTSRRIWAAARRSTSASDRSAPPGRSTTPLSPAAA
ncbi:MAG: PQQ-dependent sugar dehydrogenase [Acidobacteriota bacterium]